MFNGIIVENMFIIHKGCTMMSHGTYIPMKIIYYWLHQVNATKYIIKTCMDFHSVIYDTLSNANFPSLLFAKHFEKQNVHWNPHIFPL
jgi:hypothetical protein